MVQNKAKLECCFRYSVGELGILVKFSYYVEHQIASNPNIEATQELEDHFFGMVLEYGLASESIQQYPSQQYLYYDPNNIASAGINQTRSNP